jgi:hypothetical protein
MGLHKSKAHSILTGFYVLRRQTIMKHQYIYKKRDGRKERRRISISEGAENIASDSGASDINKRKERH